MSTSTNIAPSASTTTKVNMKPLKLKENSIKNWKLFNQRWDAYKVLSNFNEPATEYSKRNADL